MSKLEELSNERVFDVELSDDKKTIVFEEACDNWFRVSMSKNDLLELISELQVLSDQMQY